MDTYLKKSVGTAGRGTPVIVIEQMRDCPELFRCILNDKTRILFRDEIAISSQDWGENFA